MVGRCSISSLPSLPEILLCSLIRSVPRGVTAPRRSDGPNVLDSLSGVKKWAARDSRAKRSSRRGIVVISFDFSGSRLLVKDQALAAGQTGRQGEVARGPSPVSKAPVNHSSTHKFIPLQAI